MHGKLVLLLLVVTSDLKLFEYRFLRAVVVTVPWNLPIRKMPVTNAINGKALDRYSDQVTRISNPSYLRLHRRPGEEGDWPEATDLRLLTDPFRVHAQLRSSSPPHITGCGNVSLHG